MPRVLPGTGGIVLSHRVGDPCVGLAGDHVEPGASIRNEGRSVKGERDGSNLALQTLTCIGNAARVVSGSCAGRTGVVTGKHGGIDTVLVDFPIETLRRLAVGDRVQIYAYGTGVKLLDHPEIAVTNCSPRLLARWGLRGDRGRLAVPVTHLVPAALMGSGLGAPTSCAATTTSRCSIPRPCAGSGWARSGSATWSPSSTPTIASVARFAAAISPSAALFMARAPSPDTGPGW